MYSLLSRDLSMVLLEELAKALGEAGAEPVHTPVDSFGHYRVPGVVHWKWLLVIDDIDH